MRNRLVFLLILIGIRSNLWSQGDTNSIDPLVEPLEIGEVLSFHSEVMQEDRLINVYLPAGYHPDSMATYPVVYLLDGGMDEDFLHIAGLMQFATYPWIDMMPPSILIGIKNVDRKRDFTYLSSVEMDKQDLPTSGHSKEFIQFIAEEIQPLVKSRYHCNGQRMIIGQSLGGLLATEILYNRQELFDKYLIVSPSLWWDNGSLLEQEVDLLTETRVFISVGKEGEIMESCAKKLEQ